MLEWLKAKASLDNKQWNSAVDSMKSKTSVASRSIKLAFQENVAAAKKMGAGLGTAFKWGAGAMAAGAVAATTAIASMVKSTVDAGDKFDKMSKRTGLTADFLSRLAYAADLSGTEIDTMQKGIQALQKSAAGAKDGLSTYKREFERLGVSVADAGGNMKSTEQLFIETTTALSKMSSAVEKSATAQALFGRAGKEMLPLLSDGTAGLKAMMEESGKLGFVWTNETAKAAADLKDNFSRVWTVVGGMANRFAMELIPSLTRVTSGMVDWYQANREVINQGIVEWAGQVKDGIVAAWTQVKEWSADGTFKAWWEQAKLVMEGFKLTLAGVLSALDYAVAGYHRVAAAAAYYRGQEARMDYHKSQAQGYEARAGNRAREAYGSVKNQAAQAAYAIHQNAQAQAVPTGGANVTVNVNNGGVGNMSPADAKKIGDALRLAVSRGQVRPAR